ncbi:type 1 glutamine amidotransferase [Caenibius sp. WL]|uniref:type 1 glutamine amidotransferase n=1 Tax=Caenibius sp. WL TaxID=2872646 RepID=UPI001C99C26B|nr:type 1 glutamine amidotransferase [Caenibius sp. WL]QZP08395.1 type 1 glutamine amidotransferase [Caenibius sp. WL]
MLLGILKTGAPPAALGAFGGYPAMFRDLLGADTFTYRTFDAEAGELPDRLDICPAYIVTGSACGAYDPLPWIADLKRFLNAARAEATLVGICFGHQIMAEAFGGTVVPSPKGWGVGAHSYEVCQPPTWITGAERFTLPASHQDQVVALPPDAMIAAGSSFAPYGALTYTGSRAISLQLHPEFTPAYAAALADLRRGRGLTDAEADLAIASLRQPMDNALAAQWITRFLQGAG